MVPEPDSSAPEGPGPEAASPEAASPEAASPEAASPEAASSAPDVHAAFELELRRSSGGVRGLYDLRALQSMVYLGELSGDDKVRVPAPGPRWPGQVQLAGPWVRVDDIDSLAAILKLLGKESEPATSEHRIRGWQRSAEEQEITGGVGTQASQVLTSELRVARRGDKGANRMVPIIIGSILLVVVLLVVGMLLAG